MRSESGAFDLVVGAIVTTIDELGKVLQREFLRETWIVVNKEVYFATYRVQRRSPKENRSYCIPTMAMTARTCFSRQVKFSALGGGAGVKHTYIKRMCNILMPLQVSMSPTI
jgi:hypothetical protein